MIHTPVLTASQIADFHRDGFVIARGAFSAAEAAQFSDWLDEVAAAPEKTGSYWVFHEKSRTESGKQLINRIERLSLFHPGFKDLAENIRKPVGQLLGEEAVLFKEKSNFKLPGGGGFEPHQDSQAGWWVYTDFFISVMVCIDEATVENGCLEMVAGRHKEGLLREWEPLTEADCRDMKWISAPTKPGDVVFFDSYAPHRSAPNDSNKTRRLYFATYNRASAGDMMERYYAEKYKSFPPDIDREAGKEYRYKV